MKKILLALPFMFSLSAMASTSVKSPVSIKKNCTMSHTNSATTSLICSNGERITNTVTVTSSATAENCATASILANILSDLKASAAVQAAMPVMAAACNPKPQQEELPVMLPIGQDLPIPIQP